MIHLKPPTRWLEQSRHSVNVSFLPLKKHFLFLFFIYLVYLFIYFFFYFFFFLMKQFFWGPFCTTTSLSLFTFMHWRRKWQPTPVLLPGESQGQGSLVGCLWGRKVGHDWSDLAAAAAYYLLVSLWYPLKHKSLNFDEVIFFVCVWLFFSSVVCAFDVLYLRNQCLSQGPEDLHLIFLLKVLLFSVQFSRSVVSDFLWPHELQHARPPCPSPTTGVYPNSCPSSQWCHPAISSSAVPFSSCTQSLPASESFPMSQPFA